MIHQELNALCNKLSAEKGIYEAAAINAENELRLAEADKEALDVACAFIIQVTQDIQKRVKVMLDGTVNHAAEAIGFDRRFEFTFATSRDKTVVEPKLYKGDYELGSLLSADSGGLAEILALAIRMSFIVLAKRRRFIYLDEDFTGIDRKRLPIACTLLRELSDKLGVQLVINTHLVDLADLSTTTVTTGMKKDGEWERCYAQ